MTSPVRDLRELIAFRQAVRQYRADAKRHEAAANVHMLAGDFGAAGRDLVAADHLLRLAQTEGLRRVL